MGFHDAFLTRKLYLRRNKSRITPLYSTQYTLMLIFPKQLFSGPGQCLIGLWLLCIFKLQWSTERDKGFTKSWRILTPSSIYFYIRQLNSSEPSKQSIIPLHLRVWFEHPSTGKLVKHHSTQIPSTKLTGRNCDILN